MIVLAALFILIIIRQFKKINIAKIGSVFFTAMLMILCFSQVDSVIAGYNFKAYANGSIETTEEIFKNSSVLLSSDAVYAYTDIINNGSEDLREIAEYLTERSCNEFDYIGQLKWYEKSLSELLMEKLAGKNNLS